MTNVFPFPSGRASKEGTQFLAMRACVSVIILWMPSPAQGELCDPIKLAHGTSTEELNGNGLLESSLWLRIGRDLIWARGFFN